MHRNFDVMDVLSVTTDILLTEKGMEAIYDILNYMHQTSLYTTQLPSAADKAAVAIEDQHPKFKGQKDADVAEFDRCKEKHFASNPYNSKEAITSTLNEFSVYAVAKYGMEIMLEPMPEGNRKQSNPFDGLTKNLL